MIGTLTVSQAIIGFLGFLGINNFKELRNALYGFVGKETNNGVVVDQDGDMVSITKNGKEILKFDVHAVEEIFNTRDNNEDKEE